jgi:hypothetical protein
MSYPMNRVANEEALEIVQVGFETQRGTAATPDHKWYGKFTTTEDRPLVDVPEYDGSFDAYNDPVYGPMTFGGTYAEPLTYENYPNLCRALVKGGSTGTSDGATTPGYTYDKAPSRFVDDLESATIEHGTPGMPKRAEMVLFNDATISADIDDAEAVWKFSGNLWMRKDEMMAATTGTATGGSTTTLVKTAAGWSVNAFAGAYVLMTGGATTANVGEAIQIASNSATTLTFVGALPNAVVNTDTFEISGVFTSGISDTTRERIAAPGTKLYIDNEGGTIGTTQVKGSFVSFSVTLNNALGAKRFMDDTDYMSTKLGRGKRVITGQVRLEFDTRKEYDNYRNKAWRRIRIQQTGSTIDSGTSTVKTARIDIHRAYWGGFPQDVRGTNITATVPFWAYLDSVSGLRANFYAKNKVSVLP